MAAQFDPQTLTQIGRYTVVRFLAEGGMSWVFEVSDPEMFDRRVALKLIKPHVLAEGEMLKRYEDEVRLLARIEHPNLVRVYAQGTDAETGARFFTMEFIEGPHLGEVAAEWLIEPGTTTVGVTLASLAEIGEFFLGVLSALARVHAQGVFHRDIKPENILITQDGIAKLADFSIARDTHKAGVTRAGLVPGTPQYMSPEQSLDETVGATSDLFSLGLTLYRVLSGHSIYALELGDETKTQQVIRHLWALYTNKGEFSFAFPDELPVAFHEVVRRACRIDPAARFQTALEMREALARALAAPHQATVQMPQPPPRAPRRAPEPAGDEAPPRSRRGLVIGVAGVAGVALLGGLIAVIGIPRPPWGGSNAAAELLQRTRGRSEQLTRLVDWLKARPDEAARALAVQAGGDLRRFSEDLDQAATDVKDGYPDLALRQLDRADQGFATLCDRFTSEYLEGARAGAEGG
ncbi:MAG: serine/threonine-protein kinase, partial [Myxococcota bacterium]